MGLGTFLSSAFNDTSHVAGDVGTFGKRVAGDAVGGVEKVPVLGAIVHDVGHGLTNLAQWDRDAYTDVISRPIATFGLAGINMNSWGDVLKGSTWSKSWDESAHVSPGQALMGNVDAVFDFDGDGRNADQENRYLQGVFADPGKTDAYFKHGSLIDKVGSGSYDAALGWYSDPSVLAGSAASAYRLAGRSTAAIKTSADAAKALKGANVQKMLDATDKMAPYQAKKMTWIAKASNPDMLASIFNQTVDRGIRENAYKYMASDGNDAIAKQALQDAAQSATKQSNGLKNFVKGWGSTADQSAGIMEAIANAQRNFNPEIQLAHLQGEGDWNKLSDALHSAADEAEQKLSLPGTQQRVIQDILNMKGHITWQPGRFDVPISAMRSAFQGADKFGDVSKIAQHIPGGTTIPGKFVTQVLYKGMYQTPLKVLRAFGDAWPDGWLDYSSTKSSDTLEAFLNRARGLQPGVKQDLVNQYINAGTNVTKRQAIAQTAERIASKATLMARGFSGADADELLDETANKRVQKLAFGTQRATRRPMSQAFSAATDASGKAVDLVVHGFDDEDGTPYHAPILETMKRQGTPLTDLDNLDNWAKQNTGKFQTLKKSLGSVSAMATNSADLFNGIWKNGVLLRLGFTPRVMTDMGLRSVVTLGGTRMLGLVGESLKNEIRNMGVGGYDVINRLLKNRLFDPDTIKSLNDLAGTLQTAHDAARADYMNAMMQKSIDNEAVKAGIPSLAGTPTADQIATYKDRYDDLVAKLNDAKDKASEYQKTRFGDGSLRIKGVTLTDLYGGENAQWLSAQMSSDRMVGKMFQRNAGMEKGMSGSGAWDTVRADSQNELEAASHPKAWQHAINNQIMGDTLGSQIVRKNWNEDDVVKWLKTSAGKSYMANVDGSFRRNLADYASRVTSHVHYTVPAEIREHLANKGLNGVSQKDLNRLVPSISDRPDVNGQLLNYNMGKLGGITAGVQQAQKALHHWLGSMPLNTLLYHPTAVGFYRARLAESIDKYFSFREVAGEGEEAGKQALSQAPISINAEDLRRIETEAAVQAKNDLWSIMYDMSTQSTAAHQLRFIFPFLNAQQEILNHWLGITLDHPQILPHAKQLWNSPGKAGLVYDTTTGQQADKNTPLENQAIRFQIPHWVSHIPGLGSLADLGQMNISKESINPILQGQHFYIPGAGPMVQVGVQQLAKSNPGILDNSALKLILPYGPGDNLASAVMPTWAQKLETGMGVSNPQYATTFAKVYQTETVRYNEGLRTSPPTMQEILSRTHQLLLLQALGSAVLPFSTSFNPGTQTGKPQKPRAAVTSGLETKSAPDLTKVPIQGLIDQYKKLESVDPANAATNFYNQYGQALFALTMSTTKSNATVPATAAGLAAISNPEIKKMIQLDPSVAYAIVGPAATQGPFDMAAYNAEMNTQIGGGDTQTYRQTLDPADMVKEQQAQQGWQQYDQLTSIINAKMAERGITSLNQSSAQDLRTLKDQFIANMNDPTSTDYNPDWYEQYTGASTDWNARIQSLTALVSDPNLVNNPGRTDLKSLGQYLEGRQEINQLLASRPNKEGLPSTLATTSNADLASEWDAFVSQLVMSNTNFALIYQHLLAGDPVNSNLKSNATFQQSLSGIVGQ